jgi:diaminohydroxyphosphoribosylaminopyrimidine deaminase/5-amino-6-(5-phosphoribosylamino)uracil reductase
MSELNLRPNFGVAGLFDQKKPLKAITKNTAKTNVNTDLNTDLNTGLKTDLKTDAEWMLEAFAEATRGAGFTNPNPSVGCVIVKNGIEISRGFTEPYRGRHAERVAIDRIKDHSALKDATVYVTLEPCSHQGHQGPCSELLASLPIKKVVIARRDSDVRVSGRGIQCLQDQGIEVECGLLDSEVTAFNLPFFATRVLDRPFFALKWAQTLDGQLADDLGYSQWISNEESREYTHLLRQKYDAILVGATTYFSEFPKLNVRSKSLGRHSRDPLRILLDPRGRSTDLSDAQKEKFEASVESSDGLLLVLRPPGGKLPFASPKLIDVAELDLSLDPPSSLLKCLQSRSLALHLGRPLQSVLVEGGPATLALFLSWKLADVLHIFMSPKITGGDHYRVRTQRLLSEHHSFHLLNSHRLGNDVVMEMIEPSLQEKLKEGLN